MRGLVARRLGQYSRQEMHGKVARLQRELAAQKAAHEAAMRSLQARLGSVSKAGRREALDRTDEQAMSRAWRVGGQEDFVPVLLSPYPLRCDRVRLREFRCMN